MNMVLEKYRKENRVSKRMEGAVHPENDSWEEPHQSEQAHCCEQPPNRVSVTSYSEHYFSSTVHCCFSVGRKGSSAPQSSGTRAPSLHPLGHRSPWIPGSGQQKREGRWSVEGHVGGFGG